MIALTDRINALEKEIVELKADGITYVKSKERISVCEAEMITDVSVESLDKSTLKEGQETDIQYKEESGIEKIPNEKIESVVVDSIPVEQEISVVTQTFTEGISELEDNFDPFEMFDIEEEFVTGTSISASVALEPVAVYQLDEQEIKEAMVLVEKIAMEHTIFSTVLKGCIISERKDGIHIETILDPLKKLLKLYLSLYERKGDNVRNIIV